MSPYKNNGDEVVFQKWCGFSGENGVYVLNRGTYGGCFDQRNLKLSLLRTPVYSAHPIRKRDLAPHDQYRDHIDMGERQFAFRIMAQGNVQREAQLFNEAPTVISFFPSGEGEKAGSVVTLDNHEVVMSSFKKTADGYEVVLHNFADHENRAQLYVKPLDKIVRLDFGKYELKIVKL